MTYAMIFFMADELNFVFKMQQRLQLDLNSNLICLIGIIIK